MNKIADKKPYKSDKERTSIILDLIRYHLKENSSVILIDDQLKNDKSILKNANLTHQTFIFDNWGLGMFAPIDERLKKLYRVIEPCVVHTTMDGVRGVDFKMDR